MQSPMCTGEAGSGAASRKSVFLRLFAGGDSAQDYIFQYSINKKRRIIPEAP